MLTTYRSDTQYLLVADFGAQQTTDLSLGLTEAQTCKLVFWLETQL